MRGQFACGAPMEARLQGRGGGGPASSVGPAGRSGGSGQAAAAGWQQQRRALAESARIKLSVADCNCWGGAPARLSQGPALLRSCKLTAFPAAHRYVQYAHNSPVGSTRGAGHCAGTPLPVPASASCRSCDAQRCGRTKGRTAERPMQCSQAASATGEGSGAGRRSMPCQRQIAGTRVWGQA